MPILALGKALRRRNHLATLDALVEQYDSVRACQLEDSYDIALRQLRSIFFHNWHILFVRRDFLPGSINKKSGTSCRTIFTREQVVDKMVSLLQVYSAILVAQAEEVGDFESFETRLFALIRGVHNTGANHVHRIAYERPSAWTMIVEQQGYVQNAEALKNPRKGKIGIHEHDLIEGAVELLFDPEFTVVVSEMEDEVPLAKVLDSAAGLLEDEDAIEKEKGKQSANDEAAVTGDEVLDTQEPVSHEDRSVFATSGKLKLTLRPSPRDFTFDLTCPTPLTSPALPSPQQRRPPIPKIRLFRARSDTSTPPPIPKPPVAEMADMDLDLEAPPAHSLRKSTRVKRETDVMMSWETGKSGGGS